MKSYLLILLILAGMLIAPCTPAFGAGKKVLYVEGAVDRGDIDSLGKLIAAAGYEAEDITEQLYGGQVKLKPGEVIFFGSFCTRDAPINAFLSMQTENLQNFVRRGGCMVFFVQRARDRATEPWLIPGMSLLRGEEESDRLAYVDRKHPLFSSPHAISHRRLNADWKTGPLARQAFRVVTRARILAAQDERGQNPWCVEYGWGRGRVIFYACQPELEKHRPPETRRLAAALVENAVTYAFDVTRGRAVPLPDHAIITEKKAGIHPRILEDSKKSDYAFDMEVNAAVDRGITYLVNKQLKNGSWGGHGRHKVGPTAVVLLALLGSGVNKYRSYIKDGIDYLLDNPPSRYIHDTFTYDVGLSLMAIDAWGAPMYERFNLEKLAPSKREHFKFERELSDDEREFATRCTNWLVNAQSDTGYWTYTADPRSGSGDLSNTQFAVLGLKSAARCGLKVPTKTWTSFMNALLQAQEPSGPTVKMPDFRSYSATSGKPSFYVVNAHARAWGYTPKGRGISGSRTAMGISSMLIAHEALNLSSKSAAGRYSSRARKATRDGMAWLFSHWSVSENPYQGGGHLYYYLYALERVGVLSGRRYIGDRDWYKEGAVFLLKNQNPSGAWGNDVINTTFALMFLKRTTPPPVITFSK